MDKIVKEQSISLGKETLFGSYCHASRLIIDYNTVISNIIKAKQKKKKMLCTLYYCR